LFDVKDDFTGTTMQAVAEEVYPSRDYRMFAEIVQLFLASHQCGCESACIVVPGPVRNEVVEITNLPRRLVAGDLADALELTGVISRLHGIRFAGKPLGRPKRSMEVNREELKLLKALRREEYLQCIPIEGKYGHGDNGYRLNYIRVPRVRDRNDADHPGSSRSLVFQCVFPAVLCTRCR
jgi:hypothetical protein